MMTLDDGLDDMIRTLPWSSPDEKFMLHYDLSMHKYMMTLLDSWIQDDTLTLDTFMVTLLDTLMMSLIIMLLSQTMMKPCCPKQ